MVWPGMQGLPYSATLPYIGRRGNARLTMLRLSDSQLYSGLTVWQANSNQYCTEPLSSSSPSALTLTN